MLRQERIQSTHRHGDIAGIAFLMALIAAAFVPAVLSEARRAFPLVAVQRAPSVHHPESIRLVPGSSGNALAILEIELPSETSASPAGESARLVPHRNSLEPIGPSSILMPKAAGPPRSHEPRGPPAPYCHLLNV
jgi:hypothetical protein